MTENETETEAKKVVIDDRSGDGPLLRKLPREVARITRAIAVNFREQRQTRLVRASRRMYRTLQGLEEAAMPGDQRILAGMKFDAAFNDDRAIERCLLLFKVARENAVIEFRTGAKRRIIANDDERSMIGACGMSVAASERFYLYRAGRLIFKNHSKVRFNAKTMLTDHTVLPRLRLLASMEPDALPMLQIALGERFKELIYPENQVRLQAIALLKSYHVRGLYESLGARASDLAGWTPEFITAIAEALSCYEQVRDIGQYFMVVKGAPAIRALGKWSTRDVTEKVNEELTRRGRPKVVGQAFETDIGIVRTLLTGDFAALMEQPPELLEAVRIMVAQLRGITKKNERSDRIEEFRLFCKRYLGYMTPQILNSLHLLDVGEGDAAPPISFREALGILEGLWSKEGIGRAFFEQALPTHHGSAALKNLVDDLLVMKQRGSIKANTDIAAILSGSDLFDSHLIPFMKKTSLGLM
ncbi:MAG: hypothetical protein H7840_13420 [Alphaproteobacteria bacterium]